jgi:hypothetical protein
MLRLSGCELFSGNNIHFYASHVPLCTENNGRVIMKWELAGY